LNKILRAEGLTEREQTMKLKRVDFLDIVKEGNQYRYIYGVYGTSFFSKKYYKFTLFADRPQWWWSEIQKQMIKQNTLFEDVLGKGSIDIGMGKIQCTPFSDEDFGIYGTDLHQWKKTFKEKAIDKQMSFSHEYTAQNGDVDLTDYGLFSD